MDTLWKDKMPKKKITDLTPKHINEIPSKLRIVSPSLDYSLGEPIGGWAIGSNALSGGTIKDGFVEDKSTGTIAGMIDDNGNVITDLINERINTSTKNILSDFDFGTTDYAGAVKAGDIAWDENGENVTGSGVAIYRKGIVGASDGSVKFSIDATTGDAVFAGTLTAASGTLGAVSVGDLFSVDADGNVEAKSMTILQKYMAGENLTIGHLACFRQKLCAWGDDADADRDTTGVLSAFVYVDEDNPTTNTQSGSATPSSLVRLGVTNSNNHYWLYGKIDFTSNPPGLPGWWEVESVLLRFYTGIVTVASQAQDVTFYHLIAAFDPTTITWNTKPANSTINWNSATTGTTFLGETMASTANLLSTGYIDIDITEIYKLWNKGAVTNNGFVIKGGNTAGDGWSKIGGITREGGNPFNQAPCLIILPTKNNPGSGNTITVNDNKAYHASVSEYNRAKNLIGVISATTATGEYVYIYPLMSGNLVSNSVLDTSGVNSVGRPYYLNDAVGTIANGSSVDLPQGKYQYLIGYGTENGLLVDFDRQRDVLIKVATHKIGFPLLPPPFAKKAVVYWQAINGTTTNTGKIDVIRGISESYSYYQDSNSGTGNGFRVTVSWAVSPDHRLSINLYNGSGAEVTTGFTAQIYWYK
jgi:hypothetical protein